VAKAPESELAPPSGAVERWLDAIEALLWIGLLVLGSVVATGVLREIEGNQPPTHLAAPSGLIEAEELRLTAKSREFNFWLQPTSGFTGGRWSKDGQMFAADAELGDWVELELPERDEAVKQRLEVFFTKAADYGIVTVSLNGTQLGGEIDLFSDHGVTPTDALDLGVIELHRKADLLRITVVGSNKRTAPPHFQFGIDGIRLQTP
jgi:hypothetical protein